MQALSVINCNVMKCVTFLHTQPVISSWHLALNLSAVMLSLGFLLVFCILGAHSAAVKDEKVSCNELYYSSHLSEKFNETIAHTIHSMTVQGLRMFNPKATVENNVPTVNHDISDEVWVILFVP